VVPPRPARVNLEQFPCFNGLRALAALMVVVYHAVFFAAWFRTPGGTLFWNLNSGVWIFFVTSGFLLYRPFAAAHLDLRPQVDVRGYAIRRFARIYPAYWAVLAFFTFVVSRASYDGGVSGVLSVTLTKTYVHEKNPYLIGLPPAWSLVVEVTFYAFLPVYAAAIGALARKRRTLSVEITGLAVLGAIGLGAIVAVASGYDGPWMTVLPQHIAAFALGMLLAVVSVQPWSEQTATNLERIGRPAWIWWTLALAAFVAIPLAFRVEPFEAMSTAQAIGANVLETLLGFFIVVPAVLGPQQHGAIRRLLQTRPLVFLGLISYGLYLWHWFLLGIVLGDWLGWPLQKGNWFTLLVVALPVVIAAATTSWYLLERPILRWARALGRAGAWRFPTPTGPAPDHAHDALRGPPPLDGGAHES
jgi:peptidoglycan/LPS O-acetylase OafA/YrhL